MQPTPMNQDPFGKLTAQEQEEFSLCGISSPEQLAKTSVDAILDDLEKARSFFPDRKFVLTKARIKSIFHAYQKENKREPLDFTAVELNIQNVGPTTGLHSRSRSSKSDRDTQKIKKLHQKKVLHSQVSTNHPFLAYFAALSTLLLIVPAVSIFALPAMMVTNNLPDIPILHLAIALIVLPTLPYIFIGRAATCPVCHMRLFTFRHYARNRAANYIPLLGYNAATALHILFCLRYNCPGCGTPVKLGRRKGSRRHH